MVLNLAENIADTEKNELLKNPCINEVFEHSGAPVWSRGRTLRNFTALSFCYLLFFTGFWALSNLESTMNASGGMGPDSQAVIYGFSMVSCMFLPELIIRNFGCKRVFLSSLLLCCPYIAANMYLRWDTMMATAVLFGLASGPLNAAQTIYIDEIALRLKATVSESLENVEACVFGVFMFFSENTQVWGNVISYFVLSAGKHHPFQNHTLQIKCGIQFDPVLGANQTNSNLDPPSEHKRILLIGIYLAMGILAAIVSALFMDPLENDVKVEKRNLLSRFLATVRHLKNPHQILLLPLSIFCGLEGTFYSNDFTQAFIACSWGVHHVGFVTICFGVCGALMAILVGPLVKLLSQMTVLLLAACANVTTCALLFLWQPTPDYPVSYFLFAGVWGMGDAIWWSQVTALYGLMFPNDREAAFSNFFFWSFFGYFLSYSYANYFTVAVKINILLGFLVVGIIGYLVGQMKIRCSRMKEYIVIEESQ